MDIGEFAGLKIIEMEGMMRGSWMIRDRDGRILVVGVLGEGKITTPGTEDRIGTTAWVSPEVYRLLHAATTH